MYLACDSIKTSLRWSDFRPWKFFTVKPLNGPCLSYNTFDLITELTTALSCFITSLLYLIIESVDSGFDNITTSLLVIESLTPTQLLLVFFGQDK